MINNSVVIENAIMLGYKMALRDCGIPQSDVEDHAIIIGLSATKVNGIIKNIKEERSNG